MYLVLLRRKLGTMGYGLKSKYVLDIRICEQIRKINNFVLGNENDQTF
jgi:hypothetical protein